MIGHFDEKKLVLPVHSKVCVKLMNIVSQFDRDLEWTGNTNALVILTNLLVNITNTPVHSNESISQYYQHTPVHFYLFIGQYYGNMPVHFYKFIGQI